VRRTAPLLLTLIVVCAVVAPAQAGTPPTADDAARLALYLPLARAAWPGSPCAGREVVHLTGDAVLRTEAPAIAGPGEALNGMAAPETCEVWLASGMTEYTFCAVLVHELGHLAGYGHTNISGDVMNGSGDIGYAPCENRAPSPSTTAALKDELRSVLPAPRGTWSIACGPKRGAERRCVARRGRSVRRYEVTETDDSVTLVRAD
jgi:hypothetical protein